MSQFSSTWVNPDGSFTTQAHAGQVRFKDAKGAWRDVDLNLAERPDGTVGAKSHVLGVSLAGKTRGAGGGAKGATATDLVVVDEAPGKDKAARQVVLGWPGKLPAPVLDGTRATYTDVSPGLDVVVESRRSGFEQLTVIRDQAALDALVDSAGEGGVSWSLPVKTTGLTARAEKDGSVSFVDARGVVVSRFAVPLAWDAKTDEKSGEKVNVSTVAVSVSQKGKGQATLTLTPDQEWLSDPARVFPVTIDPTYATGANTYPLFDAYVQRGNTYDASAETQLKVGTSDGGGAITARSFLKFGFTNFKNLQIKSASLSLYETHSYSCTAKPFYVHSTSDIATPTSLRWSNQPGAGTLYGSATVAKGYSSSCADGRVSVPITGLVSYWASNDYSTGWLRLSASETDNYGWKKFASSETSTDPYITFTYNRKPNPASAPVMKAPESYQFAPLSGTTSWFTSADRPTFTSTATDPDGNGYTVTTEVHSSTSGSNLVTWCTSGRTSDPYTYTASGVPASCTIPTSRAALANNTLYYARTAVSDDQGLWNGSWSPWTAFYTAFNNPPAPVISCPAPFATDGAWLSSAPASSTVTCTITAAGVAGDYATPGFIDVSVDGGAVSRVKIPVSNDPAVAKTTVTVNVGVKGAHGITATAVSRALKVSPTVTYGFGWGDAASLTSPRAGATSSGKVVIDAGGPPRGGATAVSAQLQWRVAGSPSGAWTDAGDPVTVTAPSASTLAAFTSTFDLRTAVREAGASVDVPTRTPVRLDVQVCFAYAGAAVTRCTWEASPVTVTRLPHAFGDGYPTADAGVGQVAQYTGEVAISGTDVSVPGYTGDISISRSHTSFAGDGEVSTWPADSVTGVFGPGFTANLDGSDAGLAGLTVLDNTGVDASIAFVDEEGEPLVFTTPAGTRSYPTTSTTYVPATQDTLEAGVTMKWTGTGTSAVVSLTQEDGTVTTWKPVAAPALTGTVWKPATISEPGTVGATTFGHDLATGRVTRIVAPVPDGMAGTSCPTAGALVKGCRALDITYATATTATSTVPGDFTGRVKSVSATLWNPDTAGMATTVVAQYTYDDVGRLRSVVDPRTTPALGTSYTWHGTSTRIASVTQSGMAGTKLAYDGDGKITQVSRENPNPAGGSDVTVARYVYGVPTSGAGLPTVNDTHTAWQQAKEATTGYAVFGQDYTGPVSGSGVDWTYGDLSYVDDLGYTVNTASYGAGAWLVTATDYDAEGNVIRELDASATAAARATPGMSAAQVDAMSTRTYYNAEVKTTEGVVVLPGNSRITDTYGPTRMVALADGTQAQARPHTATTYDVGAPTVLNPATGQHWSRPTTITTGAATPGAAPGSPDIEVISTVVNGYTKLSYTDGTEGDPWVLGSPSTVTTQLSSGSITRRTGYDTAGRVTQARQPLSTGADAGTTMTAYYTVAAQAAPNAACGGRSEWAGLTCRTYPAAAPSAGPSLPDETTTGYSMWLHPTIVVETSGAASRTTTTGYDSAERVVSSKTTTAGLSGSTARAGSFTKYRTDNGLVAYTGVLTAAGTDAETAGRTTPTYDRWGRTTSTVGDAGTVTTTYDAAGRVQQVTDAKGATTFGYDGPGERRGLLTSQTVTRGGSAGTLTYTAAYDADGNLTSQTMPGGIRQVTTYDAVGEPVGLEYRGQVTTVEAGTDPVTGEPTWTPTGTVADQPWLTWSSVNDVAGRVRFESTGQGAAFTTGTGVSDLEDVAPWVDTNGDASSYAREYTYDGAGRLTRARDNTTALDPATGDLTSSCTDRAYTFNANGNRTKLDTTSRPGGDCTTAGTTTTVNTTGWDTADRPTTGRNTTGSYVYDLFGRQTTLPSTDAPNNTGAPITLGYFDDDLPRAITQGTTSTTFTLDANGRRATQTTVDGTGTTTTTRRYTDNGDNPAWVETTAPGAGSTTTRFTEAIGGDLSASIASDGGLIISLGNPHGDVVTTITIPATHAASTPATSITGWATYDEYGNTTTADPVDGTLGYGWLGTKQRSTTTATAGLTLMGVRLYNPTRGLFTSLDPIPGGNDTPYTYPSDPINSSDLDGRKAWYKRKSFWKKVATAAMWASILIPGVGAAGFAVRGSIYAVRLFNASRKAKYGLKISQKFNQGRARYTSNKFYGKVHYDLHGRTHYNVRTPHKYTHYRSSRSGYYGRKSPTTSMSWRELRSVKREMMRNR
jgi:RHS repeat-associated protein